jgi:hypothetical protein
MRLSVSCSPPCQPAGGACLVELLRFRFLLLSLVPLCLAVTQLLNHPYGAVRVQQRPPTGLHLLVVTAGFLFQYQNLPIDFLTPLVLESQRMKINASRQAQASQSICHQPPRITAVR